MKKQCIFFLVAKLAAVCYTPSNDAWTDAGGMTMKKKTVLMAIISSVVMLSIKTEAFAAIIHSNLSSQDLGLADLSGKSYPNIGSENFWIIGAMVAMAVVFMLIDRAKAKKASLEKG